jgi:predicted ATPase/DNA-binding SARP family transcriptional activator
MSLVTYRALGSVGFAGEEGFQPIEGRLGHLLAVLLARVNETVSSDLLIDTVWDGAPTSGARSRLQVAVNRLRSLLEPGRRGDWEDLISRPNGYVLQVDEDRYDARAFEADLRSAREARGMGETERAVTLLTDALERWHGDAFSRFLDTDVVRVEAERLEELRRGAEDDLIDGLLEMGEHVRAIPLAKAHVDREPLRERRWGQLMVALFRGDRQAEALQAYQRLRRRLVEELGIEPSDDIQALEEAILLHDSALLGHRPGVTITPATPLPAFPTALVGREDELEEVRTALEKTRLVTLVGMGGVGKSRLAVEAARRMCDGMANGCIYADLSQLASDHQLEAFLIQQAGTRDQGEASTRRFLTSILRPRETLLVIDDAEPMIESVRDLVADLVAACPQLRMMVTSRLPLGIPGERAVRVPPLKTSGGSSGGAPAESLRLLLELAGDSVDSEDPDVVAICEATGGLPLAIELAASLLGTMSASELASELKRDFGSLEQSTTVADDRRSLQAAIAWSVARLSAAERATLAVMTVFRGGATSESILAVASATGEGTEVSPNLQRLVDLGLIRFIRVGGGRYTMLEPVRQVLVAGLDAEAENRLGRAHAAHFVELTQLAHATFQMIGADQEPWYQRLESEQANLRAMLEWGLEHADPIVLGAVPGLVLYFARRGGIAQGAEYVGRALDRFDPVPDEHLPALLSGSHIALWNAEPDMAMRRLDTFEARIADYGESPLLCSSLHARGNVHAFGFGRPADSVKHYLRSVGIARTIGYPTGLISLLSAGHSLVKSGRPGRATDLLVQVPELAEATALATGLDGRRFADAGTDQVIGMVDLYAGAVERAADSLMRSHQATLEMGLPTVAAQNLVPAGWAFLFAGDLDQAAESARRAHQMVIEETGGFRVAESLCLLGGVALENGDLESAFRWYTIALSRALRAPEADLLILALAGMTAVARRQGNDEEAGSYEREMAALMAEVRVCLPEPMRRRWELVIDPPEGVVSDLNRIRTIARVGGRVSWEEIL